MCAFFVRRKKPSMYDRKNFIFCLRMRSYTKYMKKPRSHLTNAKEYGILKKKRCKQAFDFVALKTAHGLFISDVVFSCIVYYSLLFYSFLHINFPFSF